MEILTRKALPIAERRHHWLALPSIYLEAYASIERWREKDMSDRSGCHLTLLRQVTRRGRVSGHFFFFFWKWCL